MPSIGPRSHELRLQDEAVAWRIIYRTDPEAIIVVDLFPKKQRRTPQQSIIRCKRRLPRDDAGG